MSKLCPNKMIKKKKGKIKDWNNCGLFCKQEVLSSNPKFTFKKNKAGRVAQAGRTPA
jgi:hypothetical protein